MGGPEYSVLIIGWRINPMYLTKWILDNFEEESNNFEEESDCYDFLKKYYKDNSDSDEDKYILKSMSKYDDDDDGGSGSDDDNYNPYSIDVDFLNSLDTLLENDTVEQKLKDNDIDLVRVYNDADGGNLVSLDWFISIKTIKGNKFIDINDLNKIFSNKNEIERHQKKIIKLVGDKSFDKNPKVWSMLEYNN